MKNLSKVLGLFALSFIVGFAVLMHSHQVTTANRDPAAIQNVFDVSTLSGLDLTQAMKKRLLAGAAVVREKESLGVELGHFAMQGMSGGKALACQEYQKVILEFRAEGVASAGEKPRMEVEGPCEFSSDLTRINPVLIPVSKVLLEASTDGELQYRDGKPITLRFQGMTDTWPTQWMLTAVKLTSYKGSQDVVIEGEEMRTMLGQPMILNFK